LTNPEDVEGLPEFLLESASNEAKSQHLDGCIFTDAESNFFSSMTYSSKRKLKEILYET
jgi:Zn-dependent oligopeptidase